MQAPVVECSLAPSQPSFVDVAPVAQSDAGSPSRRQAGAIDPVPGLHRALKKVARAVDKLEAHNYLTLKKVLERLGRGARMSGAAIASLNAARAELAAEYGRLEGFLTYWSRVTLGMPVEEAPTGPLDASLCATVAEQADALKVLVVEAMKGLLAEMEAHRSANPEQADGGRSPREEEQLSRYLVHHKYYAALMLHLRGRSAGWQCEASAAAAVAAACLREAAGADPAVTLATADVAATAAHQMARPHPGDKGAPGSPGAAGAAPRQLLNQHQQQLQQLGKAAAANIAAAGQQLLRMLMDKLGKPGSDALGAHTASGSPHGDTNGARAAKEGGSGTQPSSPVAAAGAASPARRGSAGAAASADEAYLCAWARAVLQSGGGAVDPPAPPVGATPRAVAAVHTLCARFGGGGVPTAGLFQWLLRVPRFGTALPAEAGAAGVLGDAAGVLREHGGALGAAVEAWVLDVVAGEAGARAWLEGAEAAGFAAAAGPGPGRRGSRRRSSAGELDAAGERAGASAVRLREVAILLHIVYDGAPCGLDDSALLGARCRPGKGRHAARSTANSTGGSPRSPGLSIGHIICGRGMGTCAAGQLPGSLLARCVATAERVVQHYLTAELTAKYQGSLN